MMEQGKPFFDVWMYEVSDEIQSLSIAYGQRYMLQGALQYLADCTDAKSKAMLQATIRLHLIDLVRRDLSWYIINGSIGEDAAANFDAEYEQAVKDYVPLMNTAVGCLNIPTDPKRIGTIARDYVAYASQPDAENFDSAGPIFDFRQTGTPRPRL